jgi:hypothetical protein
MVTSWSLVTLIRRDIHSRSTRTSNWAEGLVETLAEEERAHEPGAREVQIAVYLGWT